MRPWLAASGRVSRTVMDAGLPPDVGIPEDYETALSRWRDIA